MGDCDKGSTSGHVELREEGRAWLRRGIPVDHEQEKGKKEEEDGEEEEEEGWQEQAREKKFIHLIRERETNSLATTATPSEACWVRVEVGAAAANEAHAMSSSSRRNEGDWENRNHRCPRQSIGRKDREESEKIPPDSRSCPAHTHKRRTV